MLQSKKLVNLRSKTGAQTFLGAFRLIFKEQRVGGIVHLEMSLFLQNTQITLIFNSHFTTGTVFR